MERLDIILILILVLISSGFLYYKTYHNITSTQEKAPKAQQDQYQYQETPRRKKSVIINEEKNIEHKIVNSSNMRLTPIRDLLQPIPPPPQQQKQQSTNSKKLN
jgi:hypothetical protein